MKLKVSTFNLSYDIEEIEEVNVAKMYAGVCESKQIQSRKQQK